VIAFLASGSSLSIRITHLVGPRRNVVDNVRHVGLESNADVMRDGAVTRKKLYGRNPGVFRESTRYHDIGPGIFLVATATFIALTHGRVDF